MIGQSRSLRLVCCMFFAALCVHRTDARGVEPVRPNVLFLLTDDLRADAVGALGNRAIKTPTLDKLASSGFVFKNAYCQGSNSPAVCLTSRNMILSGRSYFRWKGSYAPGTPPNFPLTLAAAGYETYHDGKRGNVAVEIEKKFQHSHYIDDDRERKSGQPGKAIVDRAISFVKGRDRGRPFFMYLAFEAPHDPRVAAPEYLERYDPREIPLPANFLPVHPFDNGEMTVRDELLAPWPRTEAEIRRQLHEYFAVITGLDHHIGRLIETLKSSGDFDRTIVIFSSDHGLALGSHGLMGKQSLYEHSMKSPLLFAGPGIPRGSSSALAYLFDIFPTICELAGISIPAGLDGQSLAPIIAGRSDRVRDSIFLSYRDDQRAVRDDRWKLVRYPGINRSQLFDLENDPDERHDLAADSAQGPRLDRMTDLLRQWQSRLGDVLPLTTASPRNPRFVPPDK